MERAETREVGWLAWQACTETNVVVSQEIGVRSIPLDLNGNGTGASTGSTTGWAQDGRRRLEVGEQT